MKCAPFPVQPHSRKQRSSRPGPSELDEWASVSSNSAGSILSFFVWTNWLPEMEKIMAMVRLLRLNQQK